MSKAKQLIEAVQAGEDATKVAKDAIDEAKQEKVAVVEVWRIGELKQGTGDYKYEARLKDTTMGSDVTGFGVKLQQVAGSGHSALAAMAKNWSNAGYLD